MPVHVPTTHLWEEVVTRRFSRAEDSFHTAPSADKWQGALLSAPDRDARRCERTRLVASSPTHQERYCTCCLSSDLRSHYLISLSKWPQISLRNKCMGHGARVLSHKHFGTHLFLCPCSKRGRVTLQGQSLHWCPKSHPRLPSLGLHCLSPPFSKCGLGTPEGPETLSESP